MRLAILISGLLFLLMCAALVVWGIHRWVIRNEEIANKKVKEDFKDTDWQKKPPPSATAQNS